MRRLRFGLITIVIGGLLVANPISAHADATPAPKPARTPSVQERLKADRDRALPADTPQRDGSALLERPAPTRLKPDTFRGDCDTVRKSLRPSPGKRYAACVRPGDAKALADPGRLQALDVIDLPQFCIDNAFTTWVFYRTEACAIFARTLIVLDLETGEPVGALEYLETNFSYTSTSIETWAQQIEIRPYGGWGAGLFPGTMVEGTATCTKSCFNRISTFPPQSVREGADATGESFFDTTAVIPGMVGDAFTKFSYVFSNPGWAGPSTPASATPPKVRCDNALPGSSYIGCVFPDNIPVMQYARAGAYPELAHHLDDAQKSGLPGAYPAGPPLTRLVDKPEQDKNRNKACPRQDRGGYPRPPTKSCDEYPMASTRQGAAQAPVGAARTHDWCQINEPAGSGPVGYSVCMIDAVQNSSGGQSLNDYFYTRERVIDADPFYVWITGTDTGPNPLPPDYPPTANAGPDVGGDEGSPIVLSGSATDDNGPPRTSWSWRPGPGVDPGASCRFGDASAAATTITCNDDGTFYVTLEADDGIHDQPSSDEATVTVYNVPPQVRFRGPNLVRAAAGDELGITTPRPWQLFRVGDPVTLSTTFTDPGTNDTQSCTIRWDDGSAVQSFDAADGKCARTHTFTHAGMYTITPGITDDDAGVAEALQVMVIVYDPAAGVASGNGWLNSPGDTGFDFTGSYPTRAATVPDGAVTFALPPAANLNLRNHQHLDWMVVTPDGKIAIKGTAERIPGQNVGFVLYGYYGCPAGQTTGCQPGPHRLRMVVWDSTADGPIPEGVPAIYDNRGAASFDVDQANPQTVSQGQLLIQHPPIG
jgi:hypothetical protein